MKRKLIVMLALVLPVSACTPGEDSASTSSGFKSVQALGEAIFSALQSKDPDKVVALYPDFDDLLALKKAMIESIDDPLHKIKIEKAFGEDVSQEKWDKQQAGLYDDVYQFLVSIDEGKRDLSYEQVKKGTFLGLAPFRVSAEKFSERFGVDSKALGYTSCGVAQLFFEHDGLVFSVTLDALLEINHRWYLAGDYFSIELIGSAGDVRFQVDASDRLHPEADAVFKNVVSHFKKMTSRQYAAKVERHLAKFERAQRRPPIDVRRGNTTQSD